MIKVDDSGITLQGSIIDISVDMARLIEEFHSFVKREFDSDLADELLVWAGKTGISFTDDNNYLEQQAEAIGDALIAYGKRNRETQKGI